MTVLDIGFVFFISAICGIGVGGGGLPVLFFTSIRNFPQKSAQGLCIMLFIAASAGAFVINRKKRNLNLAIVPYIAISGCVFAFFGAMAVEYVPSGILRKLFGGLLVLSGIYAMMKKED
jgi:uncharacterized membrane protein YfcA